MKLETVLIFKVYKHGVQGQRDLMSKLITPMSHVLTPAIPTIYLLTEVSLTLQGKDVAPPCGAWNLLKEACCA